MFSNKKIVSLPPLVIKSGLSYELIKQADNINFLGMYLDEKMSFKSHITYLSQKLSRAAAMLYQVKDIMPTYVLKNMYYAHVNSHLTYCNLIWMNTYQTDLDPLTLFRLGFLELRDAGGGSKRPTAYISSTICDKRLKISMRGPGSKMRSPKV